MLPSINILITNIIIIIDCCCCYCIIVLVIEGALLLYLVEAFRAGPVYQDVKTMEALDHCFKTLQPRIFFLPPFWFSLWTWQTDLITASRMLQCCSADCRLQSERERENDLLVVTVTAASRLQTLPVTSWPGSDNANKKTRLAWLLVGQVLGQNNKGRKETAGLKLTSPSWTWLTVTDWPCQAGAGPAWPWEGHDTW